MNIQHFMSSHSCPCSEHLLIFPPFVIEFLCKVVALNVMECHGEFQNKDVPHAQILG